MRSKSNLASQRYQRLYELYKKEQKHQQINTTQQSKGSEFFALSYAKTSYRLVSKRDDNYIYENYNREPVLVSRFEDFFRKSCSHLFYLEGKSGQHGLSFQALQEQIQQSVRQHHAQREKRELALKAQQTEQRESRRSAVLQKRGEQAVRR